jgi:hypothetical protein
MLGRRSFFNIHGNDYRLDVLKIMIHAAYAREGV